MTHDVIKISLPSTSWRCSLASAHLNEQITECIDFADQVVKTKKSVEFRKIATRKIFSIDACRANSEILLDRFRGEKRRIEEIANDSLRVSKKCHRNSNVNKTSRISRTCYRFFTLDWDHRIQFWTRITRNHAVNRKNDRFSRRYFCSQFQFEKTFKRNVKY